MMMRQNKKVVRKASLFIFIQMEDKAKTKDFILSRKEFKSDKYRSAT